MVIRTPDLSALTDARRVRLRRRRFWAGSPVPRQSLRDAAAVARAGVFRAVDRPRGAWRQVDDDGSLGHGGEARGPVATGHRCFGTAAQIAQDLRALGCAVAWHPGKLQLKLGTLFPGGSDPIPWVDDPTRIRSLVYSSTVLANLSAFVQALHRDGVELQLIITWLTLGGGEDSSPHDDPAGVNARGLPAFWATEHSVPDEATLVADDGKTYGFLQGEGDDAWHTTTMDPSNGYKLQYFRWMAQGLGQWLADTRLTGGGTDEEGDATSWGDFYYWCATGIWEHADWVPLWLPAMTSLRRMLDGVAKGALSDVVLSVQEGGVNVLCDAPDAHATPDGAAYDSGCESGTARTDGIPTYGDNDNPLDSADAELAATQRPDRVDMLHWTDLHHVWVVEFSRPGLLSTATPYAYLVFVDPDHTVHTDCAVVRLRPGFRVHAAPTVVQRSLQPVSMATGASTSGYPTTLWWFGPDRTLSTRGRDPRFTLVTGQSQYPVLVTSTRRLVIDSVELG